MKAVAFEQSLPIDESSALLDVDVPMPVVNGRDLLVKVNAIGVNPVDYKVRLNMPPQAGDKKILGWDAVGEVIAAGEDVTQFNQGDVVYYAGDITRGGSNAEFQLVDERLVGKKPNSLSSLDAAALPLTTITAWEILFDHFKLKECSPNEQSQSNNVILVVGAAGGVGSILVQLAKVLTGATVIGTASRESSKQWVKELGADHVIDHRQDFAAQLETLGIDSVTHVASLNATGEHFAKYTEVLAPFGQIAMIDEPTPIDISLLKMKSLTLHWEFMFARSMHKMDMAYQGQLLDTVAELIDAGHIKSTRGESFGKISVDTLRRAHRQLEAGTTIGKIVLEGFS